MNKERFLNTGLLEQYILGLATPEEAKVVEQHLEAFPELKVEVTNMQQALENYASQYATPPPSKLKEEIMDQIDIDPRTANSQTSIPWRNWLSFAIIFGLIAAYFFQNQNLQRNKNLVQRQEVALLACQNEKQGLMKAEQIFAFFNDPQTQAVSLIGSSVSPEASALVYWNEARQSAFINPNALPEIPADKQYQIWADVHGKMISIGLLQKETTELQLINYIAEAESLNITLEPIGGSEAPNVELLYANAPLTHS